jgi:hypothetical protein
MYQLGCFNPLTNKGSRDTIGLFNAVLSSLKHYFIHGKKNNKLSLKSSTFKRILINSTKIFVFIQPIK